MASDEQLRDLEERYEGYTVYDNTGEKIGKVDDLFVDENDREEYIGVKMGLFGLSGTTLIPMEVVSINERERVMEVSDSKDHVKDAPHFSDDDDITPDYEERIRSHFGLESVASSMERGSYGRGASGTGSAGSAMTEGRSGTGDPLTGRSAGDHVGQESYRNREDMGDESVVGSSGAGTSTPSGGISDFETSGRSVEDEGYREGYREGFREGYREALRESGGPEGVDTTSGSEAGAIERERGSRESGESIGSPGSGRSETRDREGAGERQEESTGTKVWRRIRS